MLLHAARSASSLPATAPISDARRSPARCYDFFRADATACQTEAAAAARNQRYPFRPDRRRQPLGRCGRDGVMDGLMSLPAILIGIAWMALNRASLQPACK